MVSMNSFIYFSGSPFALRSCRSTWLQGKFEVRHSLYRNGFSVICQVFVCRKDSGIPVKAATQFWCRYFHVYCKPPPRVHNWKKKNRISIAQMFFFVKYGCYNYTHRNITDKRTRQEQLCQVVLYYNRGIVDWDRFHKLRTGFAETMSGPCMPSSSCIVFRVLLFFKTGSSQIMPVVTGQRFRPIRGAKYRMKLIS